MNFYISLLIFVFSTSLFSQDSFELNIEVKDQKRGKVELKLLGFDESLWAKLDNGKVKISGKLLRPTRVVLIHKGVRSIPFYIENSKINVSLVKQHTNPKKPCNRKSDECFIYNISKIEGSLAEELFKNYKKFEAKNRNKPSFKYIVFEYLKEKIVQFQNHGIVYVDIINQLCRRQEFLNYSQLVTLLPKLDLTTLDKKTIITLRNNIKKHKHFSVGRIFTDKKAKNTNGGVISIKDLFGEYTLVDFWASWCKPCRAKHPKIKELYFEYHDKGFNVIGISIDKYQEKWKLAIRQDDLPWNNLISYSVYKDLLISSIPYTFLLDSEARIVGINLSEEQIKKILSENLH